MEIGSEGEGDRNISGQSDGSKKRKSLSKTQFQEEMLEKTYAEETYPSWVTRAKLLQTLQLTNRQLENWFYKRRLKDNKQRTPKRVAGDDEVTESLKPSKQDLTVAEGGGSGGSHHDSRKMENGVLKFKVGQLAETKTFEKGFRAAWFRCKIMDINLKNKILPEYYDFLPEEIKWGKIYATPPYGKKSKRTKKQLMVRPQYPEMYHKSEMPAGDSISEVCVVIDGAWKVGDLVDWYKDDCFWSATVTKILSDDKVQIELPEPPAGQGEVYEASCKDLRPSLDWSPRKGWTLPTLKGPTSCKTQLIFPSLQGTDLEREEVASTSRMSVISLTDPMDESPESQQVKMDGDVVENASSSDSISTLQVEESKTNDDTWKDFDYNIIDLNIMHEETLEASILDLEELANRIKWLRSIVNNNQSSGSSWKFGERSSIAQV